jgi:hypothetical protein
MSNLTAPASVEGAPAPALSLAPAFEARPGNLTSLGAVPIHRLLPRSGRRLVGPWCFADRFDARGARSRWTCRRIPHIGLQTVSWLLEGRIHHRDSLGEESTAAPGVLNLMTAGRGIAHAEVTPEGGVARSTACSSGSRCRRPSATTAARVRPPRRPAGRDARRRTRDRDRGRPRRTRSRRRARSRRSWAPRSRARRASVVPLEAAWEHALVMLRGRRRSTARS